MTVNAPCPTVSERVPGHSETTVSRVPRYIAGHGHTGSPPAEAQSVCPDAGAVALDLVGAAITAKVAAAVGAPRLSARAARRAGDLADALVTALSPDVAATPAEAEERALDGVRTTASLARLLRAEDERGGPT